MILENIITFQIIVRDIQDKKGSNFKKLPPIYVTINSIAKVTPKNQGGKNNMSIYVIYAYLDEYGLEKLKETSLEEIRVWKASNWIDD